MSQYPYNNIMKMKLIIISQVHQSTNYHNFGSPLLMIILFFIWPLSPFLSKLQDFSCGVAMSLIYIIIYSVFNQFAALISGGSKTPVVRNCWYQCLSVYWHCHGICRCLVSVQKNFQLKKLSEEYRSQQNHTSSYRN